MLRWYKDPAAKWSYVFARQETTINSSAGGITLGSTGQVMFSRGRAWLEFRRGKVRMALGV